MKKKMKKLWAVLMAVAMVLSLAVTASAGETPDPIPSQPYGGDTGNTTETALPQHGQANGTSTSEGPEPDDPIEIVLPTVAAAAEGQMGVFDMILDPHNMIAKTQGDRYKVENGPTKTFDTGVEAADEDADADAEAAEEAQAIDYTTAPKLYFATEVDATANTEKYSGTSQTLKIINKGRKEVNVDLSLDFTYPKEVALVASKDALNNAPDGLNEAGAQMYLALVQGDTTQAVAAKADDALPVISVDGKGDYLAGTPAVFAWEEGVEDAVKEEVAGLSFTISYAEPVPEAVTHEASAEEAAADENLNEGDTVVDTPASPATITIAGTWGDYTIDSVSVTTPAEGETFDGTAVAYVTKVTPDENGGDPTVENIATVTFTVLEPNDRTMDPAEEQTVHFKAPKDGTVIRTAITAKTDAYEYAHWNGTDPATKPQGTTPKGYYWKQDTAIEESAYPYITFKLVGDINNDLEWDGIYEDAGITFELTWDVLQRNAYNKAVVETAVNENTGTEEPEVVSEPPTLTVDTKATSTKQLVLVWTAGTGDYEDYTPGTSLKVGTKTITLTKSGQKLTASGTASTNYSSIGSATATGTVTFTGSGDPYTASVTGMR